MNKQDQKKLQNEECSKTEALDVKRAEENAQEIAKQYSSRTKRMFKAVRKSNTNLFMSIKEAYDALYVPEAKTNSTEMLAYNHYKLEVLTVCDRSSFNKIVSICSNELIMTNLARLPVAWSTLSKLDCLLKTEDVSVHQKFIDLLDQDQINIKSTASSIAKLFALDDEEDEDAVVSSEPVVTYDSSLFSEADLVKLDEAFDTLIALGFKIEDVAEESAEVDEETSE